MYNLRNRSLLRLIDFSDKDVRYLLDLSRDLKRIKYAGAEEQRLKGKNIVMIFEKDSTRTRCAFEVAAADQGAHVTYIGSSGSQFGKKESVMDTARVLGRMYEGIVFRGFSQETVEILSKYSGVPVWNALTDISHPTQILADFLTIEEHLGYLKGVKLAYVGDGSNNIANSLLEGCALMGLDYRIISPKELSPNYDLVKECEQIAQINDGKITITDDIESGIKDVQIVYTDVWLSMGESSDLWEKRIKLLKPYQVNESLMRKASKDVLFMHCLPAFHDTNTEIGKKIFEDYSMDGLEVTNEVFESKKSIAFDEAENRLHTIKAVLVATLGQ